MIQTATPSEREQLLTQWVAQKYPDQGNITLQPLASDAGFRRYFRFATPSKWLAVDAPPQTEDSYQFIALARYLKMYGVQTPTVLDADEKQGLLLVEDFGDALLYDEITAESAERHYGEVFKCLLKLQQCPDSTELIPRYDRAMLHRELLIFTEWFVSKLLGYKLSETETALLEKLFASLEDSACEQPQTLVHRDFHSRNLILRKNIMGICENAIGVIDFQGALWGPCTYDSVSLLRDCYLRWPAANIRKWALVYRTQMIENGILNPAVSEDIYLRWFDWMGLQRHIKVLGIFARLHLRDGKHHYLHDLPLVMRYTLEIAQNYPQLHDFYQWFTQHLLPLVQQQSWYSDYHRAGEAR